MNFDLESRTILLTVAGSRAYGINTDSSDVDIKGICIPPAAYYYGFLQRFEQAEGSDHMAKFIPLMNSEEKEAIERDKIEGTVYDLRKFIGLAVDANPNILDVLFCRDQEIRHITKAGELLRESRDLFLSAKAKFTFSGYAYSQLKRIKGHRKWLLDPPKGLPIRSSYGLPEHTLIPKDQLAASQAAVKSKIDSWEFDFSSLAPDQIIQIENQISSYLEEVSSLMGYPSVDNGRWLAAARAIGLDDNLIYVMQKEREYESAVREWKQYQEWKKSRNPSRAILEEKYLYDTKHGAHLVRLLRQGYEILTTGKVNVWRGDIDREELLAIRNQGLWSYEQLVEYAEAQDKILTEIYNSNKYVVPKTPDRNKIDIICQNLSREYS